jgi:hypothetical protein
MPIHLHANFDEIAEAYRDGEKVLRRHVGAALRGVAKPLGKRVLRAGAAKLPHRGGLSDRVADGGKVGVSANLTGTVPQVLLKLQDKSGYQLAAMNRGQLRHPVFVRNRTLLRRKGRRSADGHVLGGADRKAWTWVRQTIPPDAFTEPFEAELPTVRNALLAASRQALEEIAGDASH